MALANDDSERDKLEWFTLFLGATFDKQSKYEERIQRMIDDAACRLIVSLNDLLTYDGPGRERFNAILRKPHEWHPVFEAALLRHVQTLRVEHPENVQKEYFVGYEGAFGAQKVTPRQLTTSMIGNLVCVEGIVTKVSLVRPKLVESVHYCPATNMVHTKRHRDAMALSGAPTAPVFPTHDGQSNVLETEFGLCTFKDYQTVHLQEMPERAPPGQLPRSVEVMVENDLVDRVKPGDRIRAIGVFRALPHASQSLRTNSIFATILIANNIQLINKDIEGPKITPQDIKNIRAFAKDPLSFDLLSSSLAPSIYGHSYIKKALLLQLLGGAEKDLKASGIRLRGDINVLLVGDPGTAKSQLLRFVLHVAPLCISTTGRGASGVGLTAAVIHDSETGDRRLEAGAMVLADRGIVCIDEFDKMSEEDRVSIHEVMEQQTVTIAKAGIHASLNARCSVLGAANPLFGKYDRNRTATENIALPDSLLSRFDLLFIVLDSMDPINDRNVAEHVLRMHRYHSRGTGLSTTDSIVEDWEINPEGETTDPTSQVWLPFDKLLHVNREKKLCSIPFVKKYITYAKERFNPVMNEEAQTRIVEAFDDLRRREDSKTLPVTARTLETMIRLTIAHAKSRLSHEATLDDANTVLEIMRFALYNDTTGANTVAAAQQDNKAPERPAAAAPPPPPPSEPAPGARVKRPAPGESTTATASSSSITAEEPSSTDAPPAKRARTLTSQESRAKAFGAVVVKAFEMGGKASVNELRDYANKAHPDQLFSDAEVRELLAEMEKQGKLMVLDDGDVMEL